MTRVRVTGPARRDIDRARKRSREEFGPNARDRYRSLVDQALKDLQLDPARVGVRAIDDVRKGYFTYHLRSSTTSTRAPTVRRPRHPIVFYIDTSGDVIVARLFHERQVPENHLGETTHSSSRSQLAVPRFARACSSRQQRASHGVEPARRAVVVSWTQG